MAEDENQSRTLRVVYEYDSDGIRPVSKQVVDMVPPQADERPHTSGLRYELYNSGDRVLFAGSMRDPARRDAEVFSEGADRNIRRTPVEKPHGYFEILLPYHPESHAVALSRTGPAGPLAHHFTAAGATKHLLDDIPTLARLDNG